MIPLLFAAALPGLFWEQGPETAPALKLAGVTRVLVAPAAAEAWKGVDGLSAEPFVGASKVPPPGVEMRANEGSATRSPWIETNGAVFLRHPDGKVLVEAPGAAAALAAAEAHAFGVAPAIKTDAAGLPALSKMLAFLASVRASDLPPAANIAYIDDGSDESEEVMKLMARRNLLFKLAKQPDRRMSLNVRFGSPQYPKEEAVNPSDMAQKIRSQLTDEKRSLRLYGSDVALGRLYSDGKRARVHVLNYASPGRTINGVRVRVLGRYPKHELAIFDTPGAKLIDYAVTGDATEFTIELLKTYAVIDLLR